MSILGKKTSYNIEVLLIVILGMVFMEMDIEVVHNHVMCTTSPPTDLSHVSPELDELVSIM